MRILFVVPYVPSLIRTRPYNLIRGLAQRGHAVTLFTLWSDEREREELEVLRSVCERVEAAHLSKQRSIWNSVLALPTRTPLQAVYCWQPELARLLVESSRPNGKQPFDIVHVEHLRGANYGIFLKEHAPQTPVVWDSVDCISHLFAQASGRSRNLLRNAIIRMELGRTQAYEGWLSTSFDHVLISSPVDREKLLELRPNDEKPAVPISVLANGVDWDYFSQTGIDSREPATLVFSGKMSYHANISMALYLVEEIMPRVWERRADVQLYIVGKDPDISIQRLGEHPQIKVTGTVNDIRPYLGSATAAVVPQLYGAGIQNKVLEAMACGTPVVATSGAVSALNTQAGVEVLTADTPENFASRVVELINNPTLQRQIGSAGQAYVKDKHSWSAIAGALEEIYLATIDSKKRGSGSN